MADDKTKPNTPEPQVAPPEPVKSWFHLPEFGISVEATSTEEAIKLARKQFNG